MDSYNQPPCSVDADPYSGNILIKGLGPILTKTGIRNRQLSLPPLPGAVDGMPPEVRMHHLARIRDLYIPPKESVDLTTSLDLSLRDSYRRRDPLSADTWRCINGSAPRSTSSRIPAPISISVGISGSGKTAGVSAFSSLYEQIIVHPKGTFPHIIGSHYQLVWLVADIHPSGKLVDTVANLMLAWDFAVCRVLGPTATKFGFTLARYHAGARLSGAAMMSEFLQAAKLHFLGVLLLDEVSNLFKLAPLRTRKKSGSNRTTELQLSLAEDGSLKTLITLSNEAQIPIHLTGTEDGVSALGKRLATLQRIAEGGAFYFTPAKSPKDSRLVLLMTKLQHYQWVREPMAWGEEHTETLFMLTAGVWRLISCLWGTAHRIALDRIASNQNRASDGNRGNPVADTLTIADFKQAAATYMAPMQPAVHALLKGDSDALRRYEDLLPRSANVWSSAWA